MPKHNLRRKKTSVSQKRIGLPPGTLTYMGAKGDVPFSIEIISYTKDTCEYKKMSSADEVVAYIDSHLVTWADVNGLNNINAIEKLGAHYNWDPLIQEDIVDTNQRSKIAEYETYLFVVLKMLYYDGDRLCIEHMSITLGDKYVITFQESEADVFDPLRVRIKEAKGRVRTEQGGYLFFALMDAIIDHYFLIAEVLGNKIEALEDNLLNNNTDETMTREILTIKKEVLTIRRAVFPLREVLNRLEKTESALIPPHLKGYYRDLYDHSIQIIETVELYREMIHGLAEMHMSTMSNKMNRIMKVLTIIATIFIPLTFIVGVYGMNFDYMPELHYKYGYYGLWGGMFLLFLGMIWYFKRKKWL